MRAIFKQIVGGKTLNALIKSVLLLLFVLVIYRQFIQGNDFSAMVQGFREQFSWSTLPLLLLAFGLMPLNWLLEILKWKTLINNIQELSLKKAFFGVVAGSALALFTPGRLGDFGGRALVIDKGQKLKSIVATFVGSLAQWLIFYSLGLIGALVFLYRFQEHFQLPEFWLEFGIALTGIIITILCLIYFKIGSFYGWIKGFKFFNRFTYNLDQLKSYSAKTLMIIFLFTLFRYIVFSFQYVLLMWFFGFEVNLFDAFSATTVIFLIQTGLPLPPIFDIFLRASVALSIWSFFHQNEIAILAATFLLWCVNVLIPAILGMIFISNINVLKSIGYENDHKEHLDRSVYTDDSSRRSW